MLRIITFKLYFWNFKYIKMVLLIIKEFTAVIIKYSINIRVIN